MTGVTGLHPELAGSTGHLLWRARARVTEALDHTLPPGTDIHAYAALLALPPGTTRSQQAVADAIDVSRTTMARVARELAARGLVERVRNPEDRRSWSLTRTAEGARVAQEWRHHAEQVEARLTEGFSAADRAELRDLLRRLVEADLPVEVPADLRDSIGFLTSAVHSRLHRALSADLAVHGVQPAHLSTLRLLRADGSLVQAGLAHALGTSPAHVVHLVDDLEEAGLVERRRDPDDRRTQSVRLTEAGRRAVPRIDATADDGVRARVTDVIGPERTARLTALLAALVTGR